MRRLLPKADLDRTDNEDLNQWLAREYAYPDERPWVRANMVTSLDGAAFLDGRSARLSGRTDQLLLAVLRNLADVVLVGAETVRQEGYGPAEEHSSLVKTRIASGQTRAPAIAVISQSLALTDALLNEEPVLGARTLVFTPHITPEDVAQRVERHGIEVVRAGQRSVDLAAAVKALHERGLRRVLTEGGPRVLAQLHGAGLMDELCLTISPQMVAGNASRITSGAGAVARVMRLQALFEDDGFLFARYLRHQSDSPAGGAEGSIPD